MSKTNKDARYSAKDVAAKLNMTPKNFRKHLRDKELAFVAEKTGRYSFTEKQAQTVIETLTHQVEEESKTATA